MSRDERRLSDPYALRRGERFARSPSERRAASRRRRRRRLTVGAAITVGAAGAIVAVVLGKITSGTPISRTSPAVSHVKEPSSRRPISTANVGTEPSRAPVVGPFLSGVRGRTIAIDPGHNGGNAEHATEINRPVNAGTLMKPCDAVGSETSSGYTEAAYNLDVALRLARILRTSGAHVVLTRTSNAGWGPCITERAAIGNRAHAAVAISIHADGGPAYGRGFHVIYPPSIRGLTDDIAAASYRLALDVRRDYAAGTGVPYATYVGHAGLDERSDLGGLNLSDVPKVFIETGNMRNSTDAALLTSSAFRQRVAIGLARALNDFLLGR